MGKSKNATKKYSGAELKIAALGYETAIQLWAIENQGRLSVYNAMLLANSLVLAAIGFSYQAPNFPHLLKLFLPCIGIFLCALWYGTERRAIGIAELRLFSAHEIEEKYFQDVIKNLSRGRNFSKGEKIPFVINGVEVTRGMKRGAKSMKIQTAFICVIALFILIYVLALILFALELVNFNLSPYFCFSTEFSKIVEFIFTKPQEEWIFAKI